MNGILNNRILKFVLISPKELGIPQYIREEVLNKNNILFSFTFDGVFYFCLIHLIYIKLYKCV
jgi:hypothetical protein